MADQTLEHTAPDFPASLPDGLTLEEVMDAVERQRFGLDSPGFCLACGSETEGCEPDAAGYPCETCGARAVYGAEAVFMTYC